MNDTHEVISAFLDDEPFNASELTEALAEPSGRELLIDLLALRHLVQPGSKAGADAFAERPRRSVLHALAAAAALLLALAGGYLVGQRRSEVVFSGAPAATRVVEAPATWQVVPVGRMQ